MMCTKGKFSHMHGMSIAAAGLELVVARGAAENDRRELRHYGPKRAVFSGPPLFLHVLCESSGTHGVAP